MKKKIELFELYKTSNHIPKESKDILWRIKNKLNEIIDHLNWEEEKPKERWRPEIGDKFWYFWGDDGSIGSSLWIDDSSRPDFGNFFPTKEKAEEARDKIKDFLKSI